MSGILAAAAPGAKVTLTNRSYAWTSADPNDAYAGVQYLNTGVEQGVEAATLSWNNVGNWLLGGAPANYYIRCTVSAGTTPTGSATASWLQLNTTRSWYLVQTSVGAKTSTLTIEIARDAAGADIVASCTVNLDVTVEI